ncbi:hypothetical protein HYFRA_00004743 [Hymenoscyphus fraxineus]|uniref:Cytochrome P450 n=1 Tax=Hymenoscyphus fraxineus TaxID=746836 RepID=A0A9N9PUS6_9HELO|nr:hypothetical protein HYFRA_00004743 [Hymenoscyphus fraxineus]
MITNIIKSRWSAILDHASLTGFLILFVGWRIASVAMVYILRPKNIKIEGKTLLVGKWLSELHFTFRGADSIVEISKKMGRKIFAIPAFSCYQVLVSTQMQMMEFAAATEDVMSFRAAMNERLFFQYTMLGFELNHIDPHDAIPRRVAKVHIRENLHALGPILNQRVDEVFQRLERGSQTQDGTIRVSAFDISKSLIARMNNQLLFGDELGSSDEFEKECIRYAWHTVILMQILRQLPSIAVPLVATLFRLWSGSMDRIGKRVTKVVSERLENHAQGNEKNYADGIEWVIASSTTPSHLAPKRIVQQMVALLFASMHQMQMATTWAIIELSTHKEFIEPLQNEIRSVFASGTKNPYDKLYLMDSFLRESSRLNPLDGLTVQRKALKPFTFSDGSHIPAGNLVSIPQRVVMQDPESYPEPHIFNPFRFMQTSADEDTPTTKYADVNWKYTFWGSPRKSW